MVTQKAVYLDNSRPLYLTHQLALQFLEKQINSQNPLSFLDIGVGSGAIGKELRKRFPTAMIDGVDKFDVYLSSSREFYDECYCSPIEEFQNDKKYDAIFLLDVLEHLEHPEQTLLHLKRNSLKEDGFTLISIPNIAHWSTRLELLLGSFQYTEWGILDKTHLRFFTLKTYHELLRGSELEIIDISYNHQWPKKSLLSFIPDRLLEQATQLYPNLLAVQFVSIARPIY
jgi:trans-aconitate methyltransferase